MDVAIAFAESWKPFVKSKSSAVATTTTSRVAATDAFYPPAVGPANGYCRFFQDRV
jgi:hypothetical protein